MGCCFFKSSRVDFAFLKFHSGTQESSSVEYPFYQTRKEHRDGVPLWYKI